MISNNRIKFELLRRENAKTTLQMREEAFEMLNILLDPSKSLTRRAECLGFLASILNKQEEILFKESRLGCMK